jgi:polyferredoxin
MKLQVISILLLALGVGLAFCAYLNPMNVWRWAILMTLCQ